MLYVFLGLYFCLQGLILWKFWRPQSFIEYSSAPDSVVLPVLVLSLVGTTVGGGMFLGVSQLGFENPVGAITIGAVYLIGNCLIGVLAPYFRQFAKENDSTTIDQLVSRIAGKKGAQLVNLFRAVSTAVYVLMLAAQFVALLAFTRFVGGKTTYLPWLVSTILVVCIIASYAFVGGLKRDIMSDIVQMLFVTIGVACLISVMVRNKPPIQQVVSAELLDVTKKNTFFIVFALLSIMPTFLVRFDIWQRVIAARSHAQAKWAFVLAGCLSMVFFTVFGSLGLCARAAGLNSSNVVGLEYIGQFSSDWAYPLILLAFFGAVVSTADTFLNVAGISLRSVLQAKSEVRVDEKIDPRPWKSWSIKACTLLCGITAATCAFKLTSIVAIFSSSFAMLSVFIVPFMYALRGGEEALRGTIPAVIVSLLFFAIALPFLPNAAFLLPLIVSAITVPLFARFAV